MENLEAAKLGSKRKIKNKSSSFSLSLELSETDIKIGPPWLTRFERSRIIGSRALQLSMGAPVLVDIHPKLDDPIKIAEYELAKEILPISIRRILPDKKYQDIPLKLLIKYSKKFGILY